MEGIAALGPENRLMEPYLGAGLMWKDGGGPLQATHVDGTVSCSYCRAVNAADAEFCRCCRTPRPVEEMAARRQARTRGKARSSSETASSGAAAAPTSYAFDRRQDSRDAAVLEAAFIEALEEARARSRVDVSSPGGVAPWLERGAAPAEGAAAGTATGSHPCSVSRLEQVVSANDAADIDVPHALDGGHDGYGMSTAPAAAAAAIAAAELGSVHSSPSRPGVAVPAPGPLYTRDMASQLPGAACSPADVDYNDAPLAAPPARSTSGSSFGLELDGLFADTTPVPRRPRAAGGVTRLASTEAGTVGAPGDSMSFVPMRRTLSQPLELPPAAMPAGYAAAAASPAMKEEEEEEEEAEEGRPWTPAAVDAPFPHRSWHGAGPDKAMEEVARSFASVNVSASPGHGAGAVERAPLMLTAPAHTAAAAAYATTPTAATPTANAAEARFAGAVADLGSQQTRARTRQQDRSAASPPAFSTGAAPSTPPRNSSSSSSSATSSPSSGPVASGAGGGAATAISSRRLAHCVVHSAPNPCVVTHTQRGGGYEAVRRLAEAESAPEHSLPRTRRRNRTMSAAETWRGEEEEEGDKGGLGMPAQRGSRKRARTDSWSPQQQQQQEKDERSTSRRSKRQRQRVGKVPRKGAAQLSSSSSSSSSSVSAEVQGDVAARLTAAAVARVHGTEGAVVKTEGAAYGTHTAVKEEEEEESYATAVKTELSAANAPTKQLHATAAGTGAGCRVRVRSARAQGRPGRAAGTRPRSGRRGRDALLKYGCPLCSHHFRGRAELEAHIRTHTGERPLKCQYCEKRFAHCSNLRAHERMHRGEKPYSCPFQSCGKRFAHSTSLKEHVRSHTGEKPYACPVQGCGKRFAGLSNFRRHKKLHAARAEL